MTKDIFANAAILVSFLLIVGQIFKNNSFNSEQKIKTQCVLGFGFGLLGVILMLYTIKMTDFVIIDMRNIAIMCAGLLGGPLSAILSAAVVAVFRLMYFGINNTSIVAHVTALIIGAGVAFISAKNMSRFYKMICMFIYSFVVSNFAFIILIADRNRLLTTLYFYWSTFVFSAALVYLTIEYITLANSNYKNMTYNRIIADNLSDMISTHEPGGRVKFVSPSVYQLFGYTPEEFIGTSSYKYIHPEDIKTVKDFYSNASDRKDITTQIFRMKRKDRKYVWVETSVKIIRNTDSSIKEFICVTRDISYRQDVEQRLSVSNARFKAIFNYAGTGIVLRDCNGKLIDANPAYLDMFGYNKVEVNDIESVIHPDENEKIKEITMELMSGESTINRAEIRYLDKSGQIVYADVISSFIPGNDFTPASIIRILNNVTEKRKIEQKLRESEERFRTAFNNAVTGMFLSSLDDKFFKVNQAFCDLLGYSEEEFTETDFRQITHPDSFDEESIFRNNLLAGDISKFLLEKCYVHKDGYAIWALLGVSLIYDSDSIPLYFIGQVLDITSRKIAEEELQIAKLNAERLAAIDFLTGILNRRAFEEKLNDEYRKMLEKKSFLSLILVDIDYFKKINDQYGHQVGDLALQKFSKCLSESCREQDFIGRHGGEEFIICLPDTDLNQAVEIAEKMRTAVENLNINPGNRSSSINMTASFGVSDTGYGRNESILNLVLKADKAMYQSKSRGRNMVYYEAVYKNQV